MKLRLLVCEYYFPILSFIFYTKMNTMSRFKYVRSAKCRVWWYGTAPVKESDKLGVVGMSAKCKTQSAECWNCVADYK